MINAFHTSGKNDQRASPFSSFERVLIANIHKCGDTRSDSPSFPFGISFLSPLSPSPLGQEPRNEGLHALYLCASLAAVTGLEGQKWAVLWACLAPSL